MSSRAILDSSPVRGHTSQRGQEHQTRPRPLKRSASTASLLTPPRTVQQKSRKRSKSRGSDEEETDNDDDAERDEGPPVQRVLFAGRKKQRTERLDAVLASLSGEEEDNPFLDDENGASGDDGQNRLSSPVTFRINKAPVSPPPSRRQKAKSTASRASSSSSSQAEVELELEAPRTPDRKSSMPMPIRDTPNNPFLDDDFSPMSVTEDIVEPSTPTDPYAAEKPTVQYVFRGVRATFANPMYNLPASVREKALLPLDHPDYEPDPLCPPKILFPEARAKAAARRAKHRSTSPSERPKRTQPLSRNRRRSDGDDWDAEEAPLHVTPPKTLVVQSRS